MKKVGIIGGTFDPIHNGHLYIAKQAKEKLGLDKIIFMVAGNPPHKKEKHIEDAEVRLKMVNTAIKNHEGFYASDYEISKNGYSYTYETLEHFKMLYPDLYFITGADCLIDIEKWKNVSRILELCTFVVFSRPGYSKEELLKQKMYIENKYNKVIKLLDIPKMDESSTQIRELIKQKKYTDLKNLVPEDVIQIIQKENLYRS